MDEKTLCQEFENFCQRAEPVANYTVIPITESCLHTSEQLTQTPIHSYHQHRDFQLTISPLIYENIQSRDRGSRVVAGLAAAFGGAFSCNSNKTELTVGYATFYGDICGALAPIGDLWKHVHITDESGNPLGWISKDKLQVVSR